MGKSNALRETHLVVGSTTKQVSYNLVIVNTHADERDRPKQREDPLREDFITKDGDEDDPEKLVSLGAQSIEMKGLESVGV